jgi:hypothetical protein
MKFVLFTIFCWFLLVFLIASFFMIMMGTSFGNSFLLASMCLSFVISVFQASKSIYTILSGKQDNSDYFVVGGVLFVWILNLSPWLLPAFVTKLLNE